MQQPKLLHEGPSGEIWLFVRENGRCPAQDFLKKVPKHLMKRFDRMFERFGTAGMASACNEYLKPLNQAGKGLWVFKEFDHRLFATQVPSRPGGPERLALLGGWVKDKSLSRQETNENERAQNLRRECLALSWASIVPWTEKETDVEVAKMETPAAPEPAVEPQVPEEPRPAQTEELLNMRQMAELVEAKYFTFAHWCTAGLLEPPGEKRGQERVWRWGDVDAVVACVERLKRRPKAMAKTGEKLPPLPEPQVPPAPEVPVAASSPEPEPAPEDIMSRPDLLIMAKDVIDGHKPVELFAVEVGKYRIRYEKIRKELDRLRAMEEEMKKLMGASSPEENR